MVSGDCLKSPENMVRHSWSATLVSGLLCHEQWLSTGRHFSETDHSNGTLADFSNDAFRPNLGTS